MLVSVSYVGSWLQLPVPADFAWLNFALVGFVLYGIGAVLMILAYRFGSVSVLQPLLGTNYVLSVILGFFVLGETVTVTKIIGIVIITAGVIFIAGGDE